MERSRDGRMTTERPRCVLVLGGEIASYTKIRKELRDDDYFVFCDAGLKHFHGLGVRADLAVGDFDSFAVPRGVESIVFPPEKDDTDSLCGMKEGIRRGFENFLIIGACGGRIDHEIANIYLLSYLEERGLQGKIVTEKATLEIVSAREKRVKKGCRYFSLLALFGKAEGITIEGAKYNLNDGVISPSFQYGISNEVASEEAVISVKSGKLLLVTVDGE